MRETSKGLKNEDDLKKSREGGRMMTLIKEWITISDRVVKAGLSGKGEEEAAEWRAIVGTPVLSNTIPSSIAPAMDVLITEIHAITRDFHAHPGLGTEKDGRRLEGRIRTARQSSRPGGSTK